MLSARWALPAWSFTTWKFQCLAQLFEGQPELRCHLSELHCPEFSSIVVGERAPLVSLGELLVRAALPHDHPPTAL